MNRKAVALGLFCVFSFANLATAAVTLPKLRHYQGDKVTTLLSPDAIPAIDDPKFVPAAEATRFMRAREPVIGVVVDGVAKAYSVWHLDRHEIVNDEVGGKSFAVTW